MASTFFRVSSSSAKAPFGSVPIIRRASASRAIDVGEIWLTRANWASAALSTGEAGRPSAADAPRGTESSESGPAAATALPVPGRSCRPPPVGRVAMPGWVAGLERRFALLEEAISRRLSGGCPARRPVRPACWRRGDSFRSFSPDLHVLRRDREGHRTPPTRTTPFPRPTPDAWTTGDGYRPRAIRMVVIVEELGRTRLRLGRKQFPESAWCRVAGKGLRDGESPAGHRRADLPHQFHGLLPPGHGRSDRVGTAVVAHARAGRIDLLPHGRNPPQIRRTRLDGPKTPRCSTASAASLSACSNSRHCKRDSDCSISILAYPCDCRRKCGRGG